MVDSFLQFTLTHLARLIIGLRPFLPAICFVLTWTLIATAVFNLVATVKEGTQNVRKLHRIPCAKCRYSTSDYRLKCSVRPTDAFSEEAISCLDFERV